MKNFKVTVTGESGTISYDVMKTRKGAEGVARRLANDAFYGEDVEIIIEEIK